MKPNQKKNRLKPIRELIENICQEDEKISYSQLLGYLGRQLAYKNKDVETAAMFSKLAKGEKVTTGSEPMPVEMAVALKTYTYSGRSSWEKFRKACKRSNFIIPSRYVLKGSSVANFVILSTLVKKLYSQFEGSKNKVF